MKVSEGSDALQVNAIPLTLGLDICIMVVWCLAGVVDGDLFGVLSNGNRTRVNE